LAEDILFGLTEWNSTERVQALPSPPSVKEKPVKYKFDVPNTLKALDSQIDKAIERAKGKLERLRDTTVETQNHIAKINTDKKLWIDDETVLIELIAKQKQEIINEHRKKLEFLPINFMGVVTKNLKKMMLNIVILMQK
jgi:CRISPR/Cas system Type II protein with McrA/HNH and RuvC-like nuclease domain